MLKRNGYEFVPSYISELFQRFSGKPAAFWGRADDNLREVIVKEACLKYQVEIQ